jgi:hypothetical protein
VNQDENPYQSPLHGGQSGQRFALPRLPVYVATSLRVAGSLALVLFAVGTMLFVAAALVGVIVVVFVPRVPMTFRETVAVVGFSAVCVSLCAYLTARSLRRLWRQFSAWKAMTKKDFS